MSKCFRVDFVPQATYWGLPSSVLRPLSSSPQEISQIQAHCSTSVYCICRSGRFGREVVGVNFVKKDDIGVPRDSRSTQIDEILINLVDLI